MGLYIYIEYYPYISSIIEPIIVASIVFSIIPVKNSKYIP